MSSTRIVQEKFSDDESNTYSDVALNLTDKHVSIMITKVTQSQEETREFLSHVPLKLMVKICRFVLEKEIHSKPRGG